MLFSTQIAIQSEISSLAVILVKLICYLSGCRIALKKKKLNYSDSSEKKDTARTKRFCFFMKDA